MLKLAEVERQLGVSRWTLYEWLKDGRIQGVKLPCGHYRVPASELEKFTRNPNKSGNENDGRTQTQ